MRHEWGLPAKAMSSTCVNATRFSARSEGRTDPRERLKYETALLSGIECVTDPLNFLKTIFRQNAFLFRKGIVEIDRSQIEDIGWLHRRRDQRYHVIVDPVPFEPYWSGLGWQVMSPVLGEPRFPDAIDVAMIHVEHGIVG